MLTGKNVVVGVCGGVAAYKVVDAVSRLKKLGASVDVIMTASASKFVAPLTFQSISGNPVTVNMFDEPKTWDIQHISLAQKADIFLVAPATANMIGKVAGGIADDMLSTTILATKAPVLFVPAMNNNMYENPVVQTNIQKLKKFGYKFMEPGEGLLACGTTGKGRLPEPPEIVKAIESILEPVRDFQGMDILVTAGPTREAMDPVRYITNHSSGKMGYAIADAAVRRGARVKLISGPVHIQRPANVEITDVISADEMYREVMKQYTDCRILIMVAAVADYRPAHMEGKKIKKTGENLSIELVRNPDIARELGKVKKDRILVGTCAETNDLVENALAKIQSKNLDLIMANDVTKVGAGFGVDTNIVTIISKNGAIKELQIMSKQDVANCLLDEIAALIG